MKLLISITLLLLTGSAAIAQTDSIYVWNKWCARKDTLLLFYAGNNTIQVYCKGMKPADFKLKSLDKNLRIGAPDIINDTMSVLAMPYPGKDKQMRLAVLHSKTSKIIKTLLFTGDSIPQPEARIGNIIQNESYKKTILSQTKLRAVFPNSLYSYPYTIKQYTFRVETPKGVTTVPVNSFFINTTVLKGINDAPEGSILEFTNIKATCPECATRTLQDVKLKIKVIDTSAKAIIIK